ncbi:hypothetical protein, partial [Chloroflexus aurantiacus]
WMKDIRTLHDLVDEELAAVCFVRDYVEFCFDGPILRALVPPILACDGTQITFPDPTSRDQLCALIGTTVQRVELQDDVAITLTFTSGHVLRIRLDDDARARIWPESEAAHFVPGIGKPIQVW